MKTYYGVTTLFFDDGKVESYIVAKKERERKPDDVMVSFKRYDLYIDWFETSENAEMFAHDAKNA